MLDAELVGGDAEGIDELPAAWAEQIARLRTV
jgi:hypothetical protein